MTLESQVAESVDDAVVTDAPNTETDSAPEPSLDELLTQFDEQTTEEPKKPETQDDKIDLLLKHFETQQEERVAETFRKDMDNAVKVAKEAGGIELPDNLVEAYLEHQGRTNDKIRQAWLNRNQNPGAFQSVIKSLGKQLSNSLGEKVDASVTDNVNALASAVSNSKSTQAGDEVDFLSMSPKEFAEWERKNL